MKYYVKRSNSGLFEKGKIEFDDVKEVVNISVALNESLKRNISDLEEYKRRQETKELTDSEKSIVKYLKEKKEQLEKIINDLNNEIPLK